jgi:hypothetical protein
VAKSNTLTGTEKRLLDCIGSGECLDLSHDSDKVIRATVIRQILLGRLQLPGGLPDPHGIRLNGAIIAGELDLELVTSDLALALTACVMEGLDVRGARLRRVDLSGSSITNHKGPAVHADGLVVDGDLYLRDGFQAEGYGGAGALRLVDAHIAGQLSASSAKITNISGPALQADRLTVGGSLFLNRGFSAFGTGAAGTIRISRAHIGSQVWANDTSVLNDSGPALYADGVVIDGALVAETLRATGTPIAVSLADASIGTLRINPESYIASNQISLDGLTYRGVVRRDDDLSTWLRMLNTGTPRYAAQPYQQLAAIYLSEGHVGEQRAVLVAQQDDRRGRVLRPAGANARGWQRVRILFRLLGLFVSRAMIGYGYRPWRAAAWLIGIIAASLFLTWGADNTHDPRTDHRVAERPPQSASDTGDRCSEEEQIGLALRIAIPVVGAAVGGNCQLNTSSSIGGTYAAAGLLLQAMSWATATLTLAGFTGLIRNK